MSVLNRWFDKQSGSDPASSPSGLTGPRYPRHSGGWSTVHKRLRAEEGLRVLDIGYTSPSNINYLTGLGHSVYMADLVVDASASEWRTLADEQGNPVWDVEAYLGSALRLSGRIFDVVLLWSALDYLPEALVAPVVNRLWESMHPGGQLLAFFHTKTQGEETLYGRYHLTDGNEVEFQLAQPIPIQRAFSNRAIERLFADWSGLKQFLAKDGVSEAIVLR